LHTLFVPTVIIYC